MIRWSLVALLVAGALAFAGEEPQFWYTAKGSTEASLDFNAAVEFTPRGAPDASKVQQAIEAQVLHLFGPMAAALAPAVPKTDHRITDVKVEKVEGEAGVYRATYHYQGTIVVHNGPRTRYDILLPIRPGKIYEQSLVKKGAYLFNVCTDPHYQAKSDFWYFWNPEQAGCPLQEGVHFARVRGAIERSPNTRLTYPEYDRLVDAKGIVRVDVFFGMDDSTHSPDPIHSGDWNAAAFRNFRKTLVSLGFDEKVLTTEEIRKILVSRVSTVPYLSTFSWTGKKASIVVRAFFGPTSLDEHSLAFHLLLADAFARSSVVIHDGHSGLGTTLDLEAIEQLRRFQLKPNPKRYQIYYFNSCTSYPYYQRDFFARKRTTADPSGTRQLDIVTNGLAAPFDPGATANLALIRAVQRWSAGYAPPSYQRLAELLTEDVLLGVNGDEDNPSSRP